jgi:L-gulonate 3-dehydrogenase
LEIEMHGKRSIVILGAGSIGLSFAAVFSDVGFAVTLAEPDVSRRKAAADGVASQDRAMARAGLTQGRGGSVTVLPDAEAILPTAELVIEAGPERLDIKQAIFAGLLAVCGPQTVIATASSAIPMSQILPNPADQAHCLVAHPVNPPAVLRLIELVPAPATQPATMVRAVALFEAAGFAVVRLAHEIEGFVLNRLQGAVLREAYRLVAEGVTDSAGVDAVMRLGLGPRWALSGPFETAELNTPGGIRAHAARMGPAYHRMGAARGETDTVWPADLVSRIDAERRRAISLEELPARVKWRAQAVAQLVALRDRLAKGQNDV